MSGAYVLLSKRANFNKNKVDPTCMICGLDAEDIEHCLLNCCLLENGRKPIIAGGDYRIQNTDDIRKKLKRLIK